MDKFKVTGRTKMNSSWDKTRTDLFKVKLSVYLVVIFAFLTSCCFSQENPSTPVAPADLFKRFIENPPAIKELIYVQQIAGLTTNYFRLKYQDHQNPALFEGWSTSPLPLIEEGDSSKDYVEWIGKFGNVYLNKSYNGVFAWTNQGDLLDRSNTVALHYQDAEDIFRKIINMGCQYASVGQIRWNGDAFLITNAEQQVQVEGHLMRDMDGRAASLLVVPHSLGIRGRDLVPSTYVYSYGYARPLSLSFLPDLIVETFTQRNGEPFTATYKIETMEAATNPMVASDFFLNPKVETNLVYITITNGHRIYSDSISGRTYIRPDKQIIGERQTMLPTYYFVLMIIVFLLPLFVYILYLMRRKISNPKNNQH
jgi:hypothetical protein